MCQRACHWRGFAEDGNLSRISTLIFAFLWTRRVLNYFLQKPFFPLYCHAACRLHLADNQPPARWLQHSLTPTRRKCMRTDSRRALGSLETTAGKWRSCRNTHEHGVGGYFTLKMYLCCCHVTHTDRDWACDLQVKRPTGRKQRGKWTYTILTFTQRGSYHLSLALWSMRNKKRIHLGFSAPDQPWTSANQFSDIPLIWYLEENIKQPSSLSVSPLFTVFYSMLSSPLLLTAEI